MHISTKNVLFAKVNLISIKLNNTPTPFFCIKGKFHLTCLSILKINLTEKKKKKLLR